MIINRIGAFADGGTIVIDVSCDGQKKTIGLIQRSDKIVKNNVFPGRLHFDGLVPLRSKKEKYIIDIFKDNLLNNNNLSEVERDSLRGAIQFVESDEYIYYAESVINEYTVSSLYLKSPGPNRIQVMSKVRDILDLSLSEVKKIIDKENFLLFNGNKNELLEVKGLLDSLGAITTIVDNIKPDWSWAEDFRIDKYIRL